MRPYLSRDYDGSMAMLRTILQGDNDACLRCKLFPIYAMKKMRDEMVQELAQCYAGYGLPQVAERIVKAYQNRGYESAIRQWAIETEILQANHQAYLPGFLANVYALLGDRDHAMYWLEQAYVHREMVSPDGGSSSLGAEPIYDPLRSDPRFLDLERRVGLR